MQTQNPFLDEIAKLTAGSDGTLDPAAFDRSAQITLEGGMITKLPEGAWTHAITDQALN